MNYIHVVALLAVSQFVFFLALVGRARDEYGVKAPAVTGHEQFERAYRIQMNTLEQLVVFLPALFLAGMYWPNAVVAGVGLVYLLGRFLYWRAYAVDPDKRALGFALSALPSLGLLVAAFVGAIFKGAA